MGQRLARRDRHAGCWASPTGRGAWRRRARRRSRRRVATSHDGAWAPSATAPGHRSTKVRGIEVADAADVGIERQVAAEAQHGRDMQLDHLLPVPAGQQVEAAERRKKSLSEPDRDVDVGKVRQAGPQQGASLRGATISSLNGWLSRQCLASDSISSPARSRSPRRCSLAQSQGQNGLSDFGKHRFGCSEIECRSGVCHLSIVVRYR